MNDINRVDFNLVVQGLQSDDGFEFDDSWDSLDRVDSSYINQAPFLLNLMSEYASSKTSQAICHYALKALIKMGFCSFELDVLVKDIFNISVDEPIKLEAVKYLGGRYPHMNNILHQLVKNNKETFFVRSSAALEIIKGYLFKRKK